MKDLRTYIKSLLIIVAIYSLIINLTILLTIILGGISPVEVTENDTAPDRIYIEDLPELEITEEYDFAQEGIRI